ncbi:MAG: hypothetical protein R3E68_20020 [Burkholderiaceae bacterium]
MVVGGVTMAMPGNSPVIGFTHAQINVTAMVILALGLVACWLGRRPTPALRTA